MYSLSSFIIGSSLLIRGDLCVNLHKEGVMTGEARLMFFEKLAEARMLHFTFNLPSIKFQLAHYQLPFFSGYSS